MLKIALGGFFMKIKNFIMPVLAFLFLCGCTNTKNENNTTSNITNSSTTSTTFVNETTAPTAQAVADINSLSTEKVVWGFGGVTEHQQPSEPVSLQKQYNSLGGYWLLNKDNEICLTFDEGYENGYTPAILDTLKEKKVKAIFFVTYDFAKDNPELIKRIINEGHALGNHTYRHYTMDEVSVDTAKEEVTYLHNYIKKEYNYTMSYFRFPKGEFSQQVLGVVHDLGYKSIFWSYAYADWDTNNQMDETKAFTNICESTHPGEILLLHAVSETNANILGKVIDDVQKQGYTFTVKI